MRVHLFQGRPRGFVEQREDHHGGGHHRPLPGKDELQAKIPQRRAQQAVTAHDEDQVIAQHRGRQDKGQRAQGIQQGRQGAAATGQTPGHEKRGQKGERGRDARHPQRKQERPGKIGRDKVFHAVSGQRYRRGTRPDRRQGEASWAPAVGDTAGPETFSAKCRTRTCRSRDMSGPGGNRTTAPATPSPSESYGLEKP